MIEEALAACFNALMTSAVLTVFVLTEELLPLEETSEEEDELLITVGPPHEASKNNELKRTTDFFIRIKVSFH